MATIGTAFFQKSLRNLPEYAKRISHQYAIGIASLLGVAYKFK
jgi:hypothetical protein